MKTLEMADNHASEDESLAWPARHELDAGRRQQPAPWRPATPAQRRRAGQLSDRRADRHRAASGRIMSHPSATLPAPPSDGQVCTLFAVDIAGFTAPERDDDIRLYLHEELYKLLEKAFDGSGIPW